VKKLLRWLGFGVLLAVVLAGSAVAFAYLSTEPLIRRHYDLSLRPIAVPTDEAAIAEGRRLALVRGCFDGCHGKGVSGAEFWVEPWVARLVAPELTQVFARHSDSELERIIRRGVRKDGTSTWGMPSSMFYHLSDDDLGKIVAFIRSLPLGDGPVAEVWIGPLWRLDLLHDRFLPYAEEIVRDAPWMTAEDMQGEHGRGRYLALTVCTECHSMDLNGAPDGSAPNLAIVVAYSEPQFAKLMKTGVPLGGQKLGLMELVAIERFSNFTEDEVRDLYGYLVARAKELP